MRSLKAVILYAMFLSGCGLASTLRAQTFTAHAESNNVAAGQEFQVDYTLNANGANFTPPAFNGFDASGPSEGTSVNIINGNISQTLTFTYYLVPKAEGTYTIGPASINCGGKTVYSNSLTIKVSAAGQGGGGGAPTAQSATIPGGNSAPASGPVNLGKSLFIRLVPNKTKVYLGEEVTTTLKIYFRINFENSPQITDAPDYNGFYTEDIPQNPKSQENVTKEVVNGTTYTVLSFPQKVLFPQRTGKIKIGPFSMQFVVDQPIRTNNIFAQFFGGSYKRIPCNVKSDPIVIDVMPLPKTDKRISGAVGDFTLKSSLDKNQVKANDAVNLTITISGNGNLKLLDTLPVQIPPDFDRYDPKITDHFTINASGVSGTRTYNYLLVPRHQGSYKINPVQFTYFNPGKKQYVTLSTQEMGLDVAKGDNNSSSVTMSGPVVNKEDIKVIGSDIRYIHTGHGAYYRTDDFFLYSFPFFAGVFVPLFAFAGFVVGRRRYIDMNKDALAVKKRKATSMAKRRLKIAQQSIAKGNKEVFYAELLNALNGYFSDKFSIPLADLSRDSITATLTRRNVKPETLQMVNKTLDDCEFARYARLNDSSGQAPAVVTGNLDEVYATAVKLITTLEDEIA